jgi:hypothetical protein
MLTSKPQLHVEGPHPMIKESAVLIALAITIALLHSILQPDRVAATRRNAWFDKYIS